MILCNFCTISHNKRLREDNLRVRELESSLRKHEIAGYFLERYYPEIYGEWLEEYRNA